MTDSTTVQRPAPASTTPSNAPSSSGHQAGSSSVQMKASLRGHDYATQMKALAPVQRSGGDEDAGAVHEAAERGTAGSGASLPHLDTIQRAFGGHDVSGVAAHVGGEAKEASQAMGASAYASGNDVAFADTPDLHTASHEAAHIMQQGSGVSLAGGVGKAGDGYEQHADKVADAVVAGKSAEPILSEMTGGGGGGGATQMKAVQRDETPGQAPPGGHAAPPGQATSGGGGQAAPATEAQAGPAGAPGATPAEAAPAPVPPTPEELFETTRTEQLARADGATSLDTIEGVLGGLPAQAAAPGPGAAGGAAPPAFAVNQALAGTMIGKLRAAMTAAQAAWAEEDAGGVATGRAPQAPTKKANFIDARLAKVAAVAPGGIKDAIRGGNPAKPVDVKDAFWKIVAKDWDICAPEEEATGELLDRIGGVYKAFDAGDIYSKMDPALKGIWEAHGGLAAWMGRVTDGQGIPLAPPGAEADPAVQPFVTRAQPAYPGTVSGFISTANALKNAQIVAGDKAKVLDLLALQPGRYPTAKMILASMGAAGAGSQRAATAGAPKPARLGKPSMFYLIAFPENVYDARNREHGVTAGDEPELQTTNMPAQAFLEGSMMVKA